MISTYPSTLWEKEFQVQFLEDIPMTNILSINLHLHFILEHSTQIMNMNFYCAH